MGRWRRSVLTTMGMSFVQNSRGGEMIDKHLWRIVGMFVSIGIVSMGAETSPDKRMFAGYLAGFIMGLVVATADWAEFKRRWTAPGPSA